MINFFGFVHACGGCGTEALGAVELLRSKDVPVRMIVPISDDIIAKENETAEYLRSIGVELVNYEPGMFATCKVLMSFGELKLFEYIEIYNDKPGYLVYSDCMGYVSDNEVAVNVKGHVDEFFFQTPTLAKRNSKELANRSKKSVPMRQGYKAWLNSNSPFRPLAFTSSRSTKHFHVLRITRDDADKWHEETWRMFCGVVAPKNVNVKIDIVGWGQNAVEKIGDPCHRDNRWNGQLNISCHSHIYDHKRLYEYLRQAHVLVHVCDPVLEEALGRVLLEAISCGVVVIADKRGGAVQLLRDCDTGFLVSSPDEAAFRASEMAFYPSRRAEIAARAYTDFVTTGHGNADVCWQWWESLVRRAA